MKKLHRNLIESVCDCLIDIFETGFYADKVIERKFKENKKWGSHDRGFIAENVYDIVRNYRILYEINGQKPITRTDWIKLILTHLFIKGSESNFADYPTISPENINAKLAELCKVRAINLSYPDWLDLLCERELGKDIWDKTSEELNKKAKVVIRTNTIKTTPEELIRLLAEENIIGEIFDDEAIVIKGKANLFRTKAFQDGFFEMQDYSSQQVAKLMDLKPGLRVIDACAGAGGKALQISALMNNKGKVVCLDVDGKKLDQLKLRARRAGSSNMDNRVIENQKVIKKLTDSADRVLLDVPCSGLGVLRRNPDAKWKLSLEKIGNVKNIQSEILQNYKVMLKVGGLYVYSTCSILPSENQDQIEKFLENNTEFELVTEKKILPQDKGFDGFYCAVMKKTRQPQSATTPSQTLASQ